MGNAQAKEEERLRMEEEAKKLEEIRKREIEYENKRIARESREIEMFRKRVREVDHFWVLVRLTDSFLPSSFSSSSSTSFSTTSTTQKSETLNNIASNSDSTTTLSAAASVAVASIQQVSQSESSRSIRSPSNDQLATENNKSETALTPKQLIEKKKSRVITSLLSAPNNFTRKKIPMIIAVRASPQDTIGDLKRIILNSLPTELKDASLNTTPEQTWLTLPFHGRAGTKREFLGRKPSLSKLNDDNVDDDEIDDDDDVLISDTHLLDVSVSWRLLTMWKSKAPPIEVTPQLVHIECTSTGIVIDVTVCLDEPVASLKDVIRDEEGTPVQQQYIQIADSGVRLDQDYISLFNAGVRPGCKLLLTRIRHSRDMAIAVAKRRALLKATNSESRLSQEELQIEEEESKMLDLANVIRAPLDKNWSDALIRMNVLSAIALQPPHTQRLTNQTDLEDRYSVLSNDSQSDLASITTAATAKKSDPGMNKMVTTKKGGIFGTLSNIQKKTTSNIKNLKQRASIFGGLAMKAFQTSEDKQQKLSSMIGKSTIMGDSDGFLGAFAPDIINPGMEFTINFLLYSPSLRPGSIEFAIPFDPTDGNTQNVGLGPIAVDGAVRITIDMPREYFQLVDNESVQDIGWSGYGFRGSKYKVKCLQKISKGKPSCKASLFINGEIRCVLCFSLTIETSDAGHTRKWIPIEVPSSLTLLPPRLLPTKEEILERKANRENLHQIQSESDDFKYLGIFSPQIDSSAFKQEEYDIYISYRKSQKNLALKLKQVLESNYGYRVFIALKPKPQIVKGLSFSNQQQQQQQQQQTKDRENSIDQPSSPTNTKGKKGVKSFAPDPDETELSIECQRILKSTPIVIFLVTGGPSGSTKQRQNLSSFASIKASIAAEQPDKVLSEIKIVLESKPTSIDFSEMQKNSKIKMSEFDIHQRNEGYHHTQSSDDSKKPHERMLFLVSRKGEIDIQKELSYLPSEISNILQNVSYIEIDIPVAEQPVVDPSVSKNLVSQDSFSSQRISLQSDPYPGISSSTVTQIHAQIQMLSSLAIQERTKDHILSSKERWIDQILQERKQRIKEKARARLEIWDLDPKLSSDIVCRVFEETGAEEALALVRAGAEAKHDSIVAETLEQIAELYAENDKEAAVILYKSSRRIKLLVHGSNHPSLASSLERIALIEADAEQKMELLETSAEIKEEKLGIDGPNPEIALAWDSAASAVKSINLAHASNLRKKALEAWKQVFGGSHPSVFIYAKKVSDDLIEARRPKEARALLGDILKSQQTRLGSIHPLTKLTESAIRNIISQDDDYDEALMTEDGTIHEEE